MFLSCVFGSHSSVITPWVHLIRPMSDLLPRFQTLCRSPTRVMSGAGLELHDAASTGDYDALEEFVKTGKYDVNLKDIDASNRTALHWACQKGDYTLQTITAGRSVCVRKVITLQLVTADRYIRVTKVITHFKRSQLVDQFVSERW